MKLGIASFAGILAVLSCLPAQQLVKDLNRAPPTTDPESLPGYLVTVGAWTYFAATTPAGRELWKTDGTATGTRLVRDIHTGSNGSEAASSDPHDLLAWKGQLWFVAYHPEFEWDVWTSDGTPEGTRLVFDGPGQPRDLTVAGQLLYYGIDNQGELWCTDGTVAGSQRLTPLYLPPHDLVAFAGKLAFAGAAADKSTGWELWISDGTPAGTKVLVDLAVGPTSSDPKRLSVFGSMLLFEADDGHGRELWISDGTLAGTQPARLVKPGWVGAQPETFHQLGSKILFAKDDGQHGIELWQGDGTANGTRLVKDIRPGPENAVSRFMVEFNGQLFFQAYTDTEGGEMWRSDGSAAGTVILKDIVPGRDGSIGEPGFAILNGDLFFPANGTLWKTDGTTAGTVAVNTKILLEPQEKTSPRYFAVGNGMVLFQAVSLTPPDLRRELYRSDGTQAGTWLVKDIFPPGSTLSSNPFPYVEVNGRVWYYAAGDELDGLWSTDGTEAGTRPECRCWSFSSSWAAAPRDFFPFGGGYLFQMRTSGGIGGLWRLDTSGLQSVVDNFVVRSFVSINNQVLFGGGPSTNAELWTTDGTTAGTRLWLEIHPTRAGFVSGWARLGTWHYFTANSELQGTELWRTDGTISGTGLVADLEPGVTGSTPALLTTVSGVVLFAATTADKGRELWRTDGSAAGTTLVTDIRSGAASSSISGMVARSDLAWFLANDGVHGIEPWRSDGTPQGTFMLADVRPGSASASITGLVVSGDLCYFAADDGQHGLELWVSNGTKDGTRMARDIWPDERPSSPSAITPTGAGSRVLFTASDPLYGGEPWVSDGTPAGTVRITDIAPDAIGSMPSGYLRVGSDWFFAATDGFKGRELYRMAYSMAAGAGSARFGAGCGSPPGPPVITAVGAPRLGNTLFAVMFNHTRPLLPVVLGLSPARDSLAMAGGCILLLGPPMTTLSTRSDGAGMGRVPLPIPLDAELTGVDVFSQLGASDPGTIPGLALSSGLQISLGK